MFIVMAVMISERNQKIRRLEGNPEPKGVSKGVAVFAVVVVFLTIAIGSM
jgi:hypothetical protein